MTITQGSRTPGLPEERSCLSRGDDDLCLCLCLCLCLDAWREWRSERTESRAGQGRAGQGRADVWSWKLEVE